MRGRRCSIIGLILWSACAPLNPSARDLVGTWRVECEGGVETLDLRSDSRYTYTVDSPKRHIKVEGTWVVDPARERLAGARVVLHAAPQSCENARAFDGTSVPADNSLAPVWEWGHRELSFHPDLGGFRQIRK